ncbi:hypothetical protein [Candidatus Sneabacter namystus]|uniref:Uncharacterized protein n=1 Tax=Candidatus Sneabacter namystus TaxID=2601646 RepID=A0A5C0UL75_9RICK|nr:hypothetical protein [Candidatus Sneabacter namystus]QEK39614.1 hypothetical protein FZC37_01530 [Candidatus Sneabacter namystus]
MSVLKIQAPFERLKSANDDPQQALCRAVILQAIIDASEYSSCCSKQSAKLQKEAYYWLFTDSRNFFDICMGAELEVDFVRDIAKQMIKINRVPSDK